MGSRHATVIGGGVAGLTVAAALARNSWTVHLHERQEEIRALGAGILIWDNGLFAVESIGLLPEVTRRAHIGTAMEARTRSGKVLHRIGINGEGQPRGYSLLRHTLITALAGAAREAGVELVTGSAATAARPDGTVEFDEGRTETADLVVVADGAHSRLRDSLGLRHRRARMTQGAARMLIPASANYFSQEDTTKIIEFFRGRRRLLYVPCTTDQVYLALTCDVDDPAITASRVDVRRWRRSFPMLAPLLDMISEAPTRWDMFEYIRAAAWSQGKVAFLGDAAHAQPPYLGQGGGTAMMNAVALAAAVSRPGRQLCEALETWEREIRPGVEQTQRTSYRLRLLNGIPDTLRTPLLSLGGRRSSFTASHLAPTLLRPDVTVESQDT